MRKQNNKQALYESIMQKVSKVVKDAIYNSYLGESLGLANFGESYADDFDEMCREIIGKHIDDVEDMLGHWWILENQHTTPNGMVYSFERQGKGEVEIHTNNKNIITNVKGYFIKSNQVVDWRS